VFSEANSFCNFVFDTANLFRDKGAMSHRGKKGELLLLACVCHD